MAMTSELWKLAPVMPDEYNLLLPQYDGVIDQCKPYRFIKAGYLR